MHTFITILIAVLAFGFLIFIHEFGHYITARIFHVTITEFSIGMGPRLFHYTSKKTGIKYSLAAFPIGGFVSMVGEDATTDEAQSDPNSFDKKPAWQRFIITAAGATVNIVAGFLAMILLTAFIDIGGTTVGEFLPPEETGYTVSTEAQGLREGDTILAVNGRSVRISDELVYEVMRKGNQPIDLVVLRDGEKITLEDVEFPTGVESGQTVGLTDFRVFAVEKTFGRVMQFSWRKSILIVRMVWESLFDLITGRFTFEAVSGPVGITRAIGTAVDYGASTVIYMIVLISINLGLMNLLPIPALDGGRLLTLLFEIITKKRVPAKVEQIINTVGMVALLTLMGVVVVKDLVQWIFL